jgi:hypothetical protein
MGKINPPGKDGWEKSGAGRAEKNYGSNEARSQKRRERVEEVRRSEGCESNGRGVKGDSTRGYVVYGEYRQVSEVPGKARRDARIGMDRSREGIEPQPRGPLVGLQCKRERRRRRYGYSTGRKVSRERVNRAERVGERGRRKEIGKRRRSRVAIERSYRVNPREEKRLLAMLEALTSKRREARRSGSEREKQQVREAIGIERVKRGRQRRRPTVRTQAVAVAVARSGVIRRERRMVKRRKRKREAAGREHRRVRRGWGGRIKTHGRKSSKGRVRRVMQKKRHGIAKERVPKNPSKKAELRNEGYYGYRVTVTGTINGSRRTKRVHRMLGTVPQSMKQARIGTAEGVAKTSVGTRGLQVSYCYGIG